MTIPDEDTRQVMSEIRARMEDIRLSLIDMAEVSDAYPDCEETQRALMALQREGLRLGKLYQWLLRG